MTEKNQLKKVQGHYYDPNGFKHKSFLGFWHNIDQSDQLMVKIKKSSLSQLYVDELKRLLQCCQNQKQPYHMLQPQIFYQGKSHYFIVMPGYHMNLYQSLNFQKQQFSGGYNTINLLLSVVKAYISTFITPLKANSNHEFPSHNCLNYENIIILSIPEDPNFKIVFREAWQDPQLLQFYLEEANKKNQKYDSKPVNKMKERKYFIAPEINQQSINSNQSQIGSHAADIYTLGSFLMSYSSSNQYLQEQQIQNLFIRMTKNIPQERIQWQHLESELSNLMVQIYKGSNNYIQTNAFNMDNNSLDMIKNPQQSLVPSPMNTTNGTYNTPQYQSFDNNQQDYNNQVYSNQSNQFNPAQMNFYQQQQQQQYQMNSAKNNSLTANSNEYLNPNNYQQFIIKNNSTISSQQSANFNQQSSQRNTTLPYAGGAQDFQNRNKSSNQFNQLPNNSRDETISHFNSNTNNLTNNNMNQFQNNMQQQKNNMKQQQNNLPQFNPNINQFNNNTNQQNQDKQSNGQNELQKQQNQNKKVDQSPNILATQIKQQEQQQSQQSDRGENLIQLQEQKSEFINIENRQEEITKILEKQDMKYLTESLMSAEKAIQYRNLSQALKELFFEFTKEFVNYDLEKIKLLEFLILTLQYSSIMMKKSLDVIKTYTEQLKMFKIENSLKLEFDELENQIKIYIPQLEKDLKIISPQSPLILASTSISNSSSNNIAYVQAQDQQIKDQLSKSMNIIFKELNCLAIKQIYKNNLHIQGLCFRINKLKSLDELIWDKKNQKTFNFQYFYQQLSLVSR